MSKWKGGDRLIASASDRALDGIQCLALYSRSNPALGIERLKAFIASCEYELTVLEQSMKENILTSQDIIDYANKQGTNISVAEIPKPKQPLTIKQNPLDEGITRCES